MVQFNDFMQIFKIQKAHRIVKAGKGQNQKALQAGKQIRQGAGEVTGVQGRNRQVRKTESRMLER